jgi:hypothetical protein
MGGSDRLWVMRWTQRANSAEGNLFVIGLRRTLLMQTSASQLV